MPRESGWESMARAYRHVLGPGRPVFGRRAGYTVLYTLAMLVGRASAEPTSGVALVWPAAGVTFAWYLTALCEEPGERRKEIGWATALTLLVSWYLNVVSGLSGPISLVFPAGNLVAALLSAWIYLRWGPAVGYHLTGLRDVPVLVVASLVGGTVSSAIGPLYMVIIDGTVPPPIWQLTARTAGSTLIFGAALLRLLSPPSALRRPRGLTALVLIVLAVTTYWATFWPLAELPVTFTLTSMTVFAALLLTVDGVLIYLLMCSAFLACAAYLGAGPFTVAGPMQGVFLAQSFAAVQAVIGLLLVLGREDQVRLVRALSAARREAETQSDMVRRVVSGMTEAVLAVDGRRVVLGNDSAATMFGLRSGMSVVGSMLFEGGPVGTLPLDRALRGTSVAEDLLIEEPGSAPQVLALRVEPLAGPPGRAVAVARDITDQRRQVSELSSFASTLAHDLLNPIGAVQGWLEVLEDECDDDTPATVRNATSRAMNAADRLREIVTGFHSYSVARGGELSMTDIDLQALGERLAAARVAIATAGEGNGVPEITVDAPQWVRGDEALVAQVLDNLLGNAVKYTHEGRPARIAVTAHPPVDGMVRIRVDDEGIGIPESDRERIFEEFHRVEGHAGSYVGTGLGLSICRRMVERHGGTIRATASPAGGTRVEFTLPVSQTGSDEHEPHGAPTSHGATAVGTMRETRRRSGSRSPSS